MNSTEQIQKDRILRRGGVWSPFSPFGNLPLFFPPALRAFRPVIATYFFRALSSARLENVEKRTIRQSRVFARLESYVDNDKDLRSLHLRTIVNLHRGICNGFYLGALRVFADRELLAVSGRFDFQVLLVEFSNLDFLMTDTYIFIGREQVTLDNFQIQ